MASGRGQSRLYLRRPASTRERMAQAFDLLKSGPGRLEERRPGFDPSAGARWLLEGDDCCADVGQRRAELLAGTDSELSEYLA